MLFFQEEDRIRDAHELLEFRRVLFRSPNKHTPRHLCNASKQRFLAPRPARFHHKGVKEIHACRSSLARLPPISRLTARKGVRSEERSGGKECDSTCRIGWSTDH